LGVRIKSDTASEGFSDHVRITKKATKKQRNCGEPIEVEPDSLKVAFQRRLKRGVRGKIVPLEVAQKQEMMKNGLTYKK